MMIEKVKIADIVPAAYNPRIITDDVFEMLKKSISTIGFVIPVIINRQNNIIIAGHQRTKAAKAVGLSEVPAFFVDDINPGDEIKFNQFHNGTDSETLRNTALPFKLSEGFQQVDVSSVETNEKDSALTVRDISYLILKYGNVFCAVSSPSKIILHTDYIKACKLMNIPANISVLSEEKAKLAQEYLGKQYGQYSYAHLKKDTYVQGLAQMQRLAGGNKKQNVSRLYENMVLPYIAEHGTQSVLDFGCGKGAYIERVVKTPQKVGLEFYNNNGSQINTTKGNQQIDALIDHLRRFGQFDIVVCDSVLNSVDCIEAEEAVMTCLCAFSKGKVFFSGRSLRFTNARMNTSYVSGNKNYRYFVDADGFTANYRKGKWYYQHFHEKKDVEQLCEKNGLILEKFTNADSSWRCEATIKKRPTREQIIKAVNYEFNLPLPNGKKYARSDDVRNALKDAGVL